MSDTQIHFVKGEFHPIFSSENTPRLLYVSKAQPSDQAHPRILHAHSDLVEVLLVYCGTGNFLVGETSYHVQEGDLLIYNSNVVHDEISSLDDAVGIYCIGIGGLKLPGLRENTLVADGEPPVFQVGDELEDLARLYDIMLRYLTEEYPGGEAMAQYLMLALLSRVLRIIGAGPPRPGSEATVLSRRIQEYIDRHYAEPLTLQAIGQALHMSPYYLAHVFKETSGYSPIQYLLRRRIGEAQSLLINTDLPISRIGEQVGYETPNYFNMQFSKHVGMPPKKYRQTFVGSNKPPHTD